MQKKSGSPSAFAAASKASPAIIVTKTTAAPDSKESQTLGLDLGGDEQLQQHDGAQQQDSGEQTISSRRSLSSILKSDEDFKCSYGKR